MFRTLALAATLFIVNSAQAFADSSIRFTLTAHVDVFCQIFPPSDSEIKVVNGSAAIGQIREFCNTPNGYEVLTSFSNLSGGRLLVNDNDYAIDESGGSLRSNPEAAAKTLTWRLAEAQVTTPQSPVFMRVTISPR